MPDEKADRLLKDYNWRHKVTEDIYRHAARRFGMSECAMWILYSLRLSKGTITQKELCDVIAMPKQTVNTALKRLVEEGHVTLVPDASDHRIKCVLLTERGVKRAQESADEVIEAELAAFRGFTEEEIDAYIAFQDRLNQRLQNALGVPAQT